MNLLLPLGVLGAGLGYLYWQKEHPGAVHVPLGQSTTPVGRAAQQAAAASAPVASQMSVADAQGALNALGYQPPLAADGVAGPKTTEALKKFQSKANISVDGVLGPQTSAALRLALSNQASGAYAASGSYAVGQYVDPMNGCYIDPTTGAELDQYGNPCGGYGAAPAAPYGYTDPSQMYAYPGTWPGTTGYPGSSPNPYGYPPNPYAQSPYGQPPYGQPPYGQQQYGQQQYGQQQQQQPVHRGRPTCPTGYTMQPDGIHCVKSH